MNTPSHGLIGLLHRLICKYHSVNNKPISWHPNFMHYHGFGFWTIFAEDQATKLGTYFLYSRAIKRLEKYAKTLNISANLEMLLIELKRRAMLYVQDNIAFPKERDYIYIENAFILGAIIAGEMSSNNKPIDIDPAILTQAQNETTTSH